MPHVYGVDTLLCGGDLFGVRCHFIVITRSDVSTMRIFTPKNRGLSRKMKEGKGWRGSRYDVFSFVSIPLKVSPES